ncbi:MAG: hypothetical protein COY66_03155 [Candidatus Kerfeldbacteria bacterium CG_4_10_14_0_8_um_filter_42_10]|uniref:Phosphoesterase n=1 Tax=Candidatus Kerfeldbacteria bacterium CG_4_10_14_0_8_um_filter_42_10 TaxID=2014248 RepID=A0A2M7RJ27_9BACT|nr:MAG: hypothetical protein COY66_03155 [Candidatus Kerfeldbacteria bacterium CG_4_10_14_0_8_um_filter_42_10]
MKIAIISDTQDNLINTQRALEIINQSGAEAIIHCGDLCSPWILKELTSKFAGPIHLTFGNNDAEEFLFMEWTKTEGQNAKFYKPMGELELGGKKIAFTHYSVFGEGLAATQKYDLVIYGHNHLKSEQLVGQTLLINPGSLCGIGQPASFAIYDSENNQVTFESI